MSDNPFFLDIETQRTDNADVIARLRSKVKPPGNYKKADSIAQWWAGEGQAALVEAVDRTALDGTWGRLASIAWASGTSGDITCVFNEPEPVLLLSLKAALYAENIKDPFTDEVVVAFNGEFDFRFLYQRYIINKIKPPYLPGLSKNDWYFDPMKEWAGYRGYVSQQDLETAFGIKRTDTLTGADIGTAIDAGDWEAVRFHNVEDVHCLQEIYKRMHI